MRVLICGLNFAPELIGIGKYTGELAQFLSEHGNSVRVVTTPPYYPHWKIQTGYSGWDYKKENWNGITVYRCPLWVPKQPSGIKRIIHLCSFAISSLPVLISQIPWKPDLVFVVAPALFSAPGAILLSWTSNCKTWLHIQDFELDAAFRMNLLPGSKLLEPLALFIESTVMRMFHRVSTVSKRMMELLEQKKIPIGRIVLYPNWVDTRVIYPFAEPSPMRSKFGIQLGKIVVLYSGNMGRKQGLGLLIQTARILEEDEDILFVLCGEGAARHELEAQAQDLHNIKFLPLQPAERLNELLNMADIHVLPQRSDAADLVMPSKLTGMLASGKPVVTTASPDTELAIELGAIIRIVPPDNAPALAEALRYFASNKVAREHQGSLGYSFVLQHWTRDKVLGDILVKFEHLVHTPKTGYIS
jgi:colanic acid biosynthesis glycosyl transferase WcaI